LVYSQFSQCGVKVISGNITRPFITGQQISMPYIQVFLNAKNAPDLARYRTGHDVMQITPVSLT
jgi:hypothetical protein